jgi:membrane-associated phospholipid phosphatase
LPRELRRSGRLWAAVAVAVFVFWLVALVTNGALTRPFENLDDAILRRVGSLRSDAGTRLFRGIHALGSAWTIRLLVWPGFIACLVVKRFRHALVFIGSLLFVRAIVGGMSVAIARPRPLAVPILGDWDGFSHPSLPLAVLAGVLLGGTYALVPHGHLRQLAKFGTGVCVGLLGVARVYLAVDHPSDVVVGVVIGVVVPLLAFRLLCPNEVFPVAWRRGRAAHLDVGGRRGEAIRRALEEQLGLCVLEVEPFGLAGSGGSTPLRIKVAGDPDTFLFGKLYASTHLRADRWYKLGRTLLYGRLEDEGSFSTVRRLVQYEDYVLRVMQGARIPSAEPYGFVEITPEREYLLVTEFFTGAREIGEVDVDDHIADEALRVVRALWDAGLAHRDIKPSNVLVREGRVLLIDMAFAEVRPSPWRQAVDLANMMLTLALRCDARKVYERALRFFTPDEIAEAFAATRGMTSPSQLRNMMKGAAPDLLREFRQLAPPRPPIKIQRWSVRRLGLTAGVAVGALLLFSLLISTLQNVQLL